MVHNSMYAMSKAGAHISLVHPHLETCVSVWTPYRKGSRDLEMLEKVQRRAVRWICGSYPHMCEYFKWNLYLVDCQLRLALPAIEQWQYTFSHV